MAQRKERAKVLLNTTALSDRAIEKQAGLGHGNVAKLRRDAEVNGENRHKANDGDDTESHEPPPSLPTERLEAGLTKAGTPRKTRGRKPGSGKKPSSAAQRRTLLPKRDLKPCANKAALPLAANSSHEPNVWFRQDRPRTGPSQTHPTSPLPVPSRRGPQWGMKTGSGRHGRAFRDRVWFRLAGVPVPADRRGWQPAHAP